MNLIFKFRKKSNKSNIEKHGITFEEATIAFSDENSVYSFDRNVNGETRQHIIGRINELIITLVVYTNRNGSIRLISARRANKKERERYYVK